MQSSNKPLRDVIFSSATHKLIIPQFQRHYAWDETQIIDFWNDISGNDQNFLGPIILNTENEENGYYEVVDGQQRLITSTIFASLLRNKFYELGDKAKANKVHENYIAFVDEDNNDKGYRLTAGESSNKYLKKLIQEYKPFNNSIKGENIHEIRIIKNYNILLNEINEYVSRNNASQDIKIERLSTLRNNLNEMEVIEIKINSDDQAFEIFERINNYGLDLTTSDLLKNHILKNTRKNKETSFRKWNELEENITETGTDLKKFVRYYWLSKEKFVTEKQLYKNIKIKIEDYNSFLDQLLSDSEIYQQIKSLNKNDFQVYQTKNNYNVGNKVYNTISANELMGVSQVDVFYLSLIRNLEKNLIVVKPERILKCIEDFCFQYFAVCGLPANRVERMFSKYAIELEKCCTGNEKNDTKNQDACFNNFKTDLIRLKPDKEQFIEKFKEIKYTNTSKSRKLLKYILEKIENHLSKEEVKVPEKTIDFDTVNIEHILPQKPESWGLSRNEVKNYVNLIGNLTLINSSLNTQMGNRMLSNKIELLEKSKIKLNQILIKILNENQNEWNERLIIERSNVLGEIAFHEVWKL